MVPMRIEVLQAGKVVLAVKLLEVQFREKFDEGVFAKP
jgi:hypothetical protein